MIQLWFSERTRAALTGAKARDVVLGATGPKNLGRHVLERQKAAEAFRQRLGPILTGLKAQGLSQWSMVAQLNALGVHAAEGGAWTLSQLQRVMSALPQ